MDQCPLYKTYTLILIENLGSILEPTRTGNDSLNRTREVQI